MKKHTGLSLKVDLEDEKIEFPPIDIRDKEYFFFPFNMKIGDAVLKTALATPLCILNNERKTYVFYSNYPPQFNFAGDLGNNKIVNIGREEAKNAWRVNLDKEYLIISNSAVIQTENEIEIIGREDVLIKVYPPIIRENVHTSTTENSLIESLIRKDFEYIGMDGDFTVYKKKIKDSNVNIGYELIADLSYKRVYAIKLDYPDKSLEDCFLQISYAGDRARLYWKEECLADQFYYGKTWEIGLKRFDFPDELRLEVYSLEEDAPVFLEDWPVMENGKVCRIFAIRAEVEYVTIIK